MTHIPKSSDIDSTFSIAADGYAFVSKTCRELKSDIFLTRLMLRKTICMKGKEAAEIFYNTDYFERKGVTPNFVKSTLLGHGGVQGLDGQAHQVRKQMFMEIMNKPNIQILLDLAESKWIQYATEWEKKANINLFDEVENLLCEAICEWVGIPISKEELDQRARDFTNMIEGAGTMGFRRHLQGRKARSKTEKWISEIIFDLRGEKETDEKNEQNALQRFTWHRDQQGELLPIKTVAVEIINLLRPTVAVSRFILFAALALHKFPEQKSKIKANDEYLLFFVNEVRRYYPFFPFNMARVKKEFEWKNYSFPKGINVLMDFYGTNHDDRLWDNPEEFNPERFRNRKDDAFDLIPQGGGDYDTNHRCAGEFVTIELMKQAVRFLTKSIQYNVPDQDLEIDLSTIPAIPKSRFVIDSISFS